MSVRHIGNDAAADGFPQYPGALIGYPQQHRFLSPEVVPGRQSDCHHHDYNHEAEHFNFEGIHLIS
jgi:hypothetical protein